MRHTGKYTNGEREQSTRGKWKIAREGFSLLLAADDDKEKLTFVLRFVSGPQGAKGHKIKCVFSPRRNWWLAIKIISWKIHSLAFIPRFELDLSTKYHIKIDDLCQRNQPNTGKKRHSNIVKKQNSETSPQPPSKSWFVIMLQDNTVKTPHLNNFIRQSETWKQNNSRESNNKKNGTRSFRCDIGQ